MQFFLTLAPTPWLDGKHTIFGRVYSGMGTVQRLGNIQTGMAALALLWHSFSHRAWWRMCIHNPDCSGPGVMRPYSLVCHHGPAHVFVSHALV